MDQARRKLEQLLSIGQDSLTRPKSILDEAAKLGKQRDREQVSRKTSFNERNFREFRREKN